MKHILIILVLAITIPCKMRGQDVYMYSVKDIEGKSIALSQHKGKKMLFLVAPISEGDSTLAALAEFQKQYAGKVVVFLIPSIEEGYKKENASKLKKQYQSYKNMVLLTDGLFVKKASGTGQASLFQWLTKKEGNRHFDQDVRGVGHKFFVDETGELYAVIGPEFSLTSKIVERVMNRQPKPSGK